MVGLQANNHAELEAYLDWGQAFVRHTPRANIYANMVIALDALGRKEEARVLRREALVLYPGDPLLTGSLPPPWPRRWSANPRPDSGCRGHAGRAGCAMFHQLPHRLAKWRYCWTAEAPWLR